MKIRTPEERETLIETIRNDLSGVLEKYQGEDCSREIIYAIAGAVRKVEPCADLDSWPKFVDGAFYLASR
jgi:hypothetical protein